MIRLAPPACMLLLVLACDSLFAAAPAMTPATQPTMFRRLTDATAKVKAARAAMEAAKVDAVRRFDAGKGRVFVQDLAAKAAAAGNAGALAPQARTNAISAFLQAKSDIAWAHSKAIEDDPGVAAATQAVAAAHAEREALRREADSLAAGE